MVLIILIILLLYITSSSSSIYSLNRLATLGLLYVLYLVFDSLDPRYSNFTVYNDWFKLSDTNLPIIYIQLLLVIILLIYTTVNQRYFLQSTWVYPIILFNLLGLLLFPIVNDMLLLYIIIELQSYSLYILTGIHHKSYNSTRGSMLYFVTGGIASIGILVAIYMVYNLIGTCNITEISNYYTIHNINNIFDPIDILIISLIFKMGLAPLHSWSIAVYNYAPTYITAYISIVAKISILSWIYINANLVHLDIIILIFIISIAIAGYKPLFQVNIKTILAYSGILNFGYLLIPVVLQDPAYYIYLIQYIITHMLIFLCLLASNKFIINPNSDWSPIVNVNQLIIPNRMLIFILIICFLSLIGIPPLPGFYGKYYILVSLLHNNYTLESLSIIIFSVIATYYYAYIIKQLASNYTRNMINEPINNTLSIIISILFVIFLGYYIYIFDMLNVINIILS